MHLKINLETFLFINLHSLFFKDFSSMIVDERVVCPIVHWPCQDGKKIQIKGMMKTFFSFPFHWAPEYGRILSIYRLHREPKDYNINK